jgi:hypothetical protein
MVITGDWEDAEAAAIAPRDVAAAVTQLRGRAPGALPPVGDVLVTDRATVADVIAAVTALDGAGVATVGVGVSPFPYPP